MILAFHSVFCAYGFWLPNDPRGSWSDFVASWDLFRYGRATTTETRRSVAGKTHDSRLREEAKTQLKYPPVHWTGLQAESIGKGFGEAIAESSYRVHACSILPEHVHLVIGQTDRSIRRVVGHLKGRATQQLAKDELWPDPGCPVWAAGGWQVFINCVEHLEKAIAYVEGNPLKERKPAQRWSFVTPWTPI